MAHFYHHHQPSHATPTTRARPARPQPRPAPSPSTSSIRHHSHVSMRSQSSALVDPVLTYNPRAPHASIEYDVIHPPSHILVSHGPSRSSYAGLSSRDLSSPATAPPVSHMRIKCEHLPWSIDVYPAVHAGIDVVTVGDVLQGIYRSLRHRVSGSDWHAISTDMQHRVRNAWVRRCKRQQSRTERTYEESQGLRRVDWLAKNTVFQGLSPGKSRDHWIMHVGQGEKSVKFWAGA